MAGNDTIRTKPKDAKGTLLRMLSYLGPYKLFIFMICLVCLLGNFLALLGPSMAGKAINEVSAGKGQVNFDMVNYYAIRMAICYILSAVITIFINSAMLLVSKWVSRKLRKDIFEKLMKLPVGYFDTHQAGDIISRVSYDVDVIGTCLATDVVQILTNIVTVMGSLVMMIVISPLLSLTVIITVPMAIGYTAHLKKITHPLYSKRSKNYGRMNGFVEEMLSGQKTIISYAYEDTVEANFDSINRDVADSYNNAEYHGCCTGPTVNLINNLGLSFIAVFGSILYMFEMISIGNISSFVLYSRKFSGPINEIANVVNEIYSALSATERVFTLLDAGEELADSDTATELTDVKGKVNLKKVYFGYDRRKTIINDLNLDVDPGKLIAIVGPTGAGKTTIINLLMRFYDVNSGNVLVEDKAITDLTRSSLRSAYAMVLQDTWVFNGTIFDNIAYGKENATREEVEAAAKAAHIHHFIMRLPKGYDTVISEDGGNISKGQKQLLTIARAMLYDAKMLILDEATSNVDTGTEREIQKAMRSLMKDKTCFVIAHRLSTIQHADAILVLDHGDVVEQGTHESLMEKRGFYYNLYASQFE